MPKIESSILNYIESLTLLCVEDNKTTQLLYNSIFEGIVKNIIFADNGEEGYKMFQEQDVDLIIADYDMPKLNGIEMISKIRDDNKEIPIILVSAIKDLDVIVEALKLNVNNFLKKPIIAQEVMQAIENVSKIVIANNYLREQKEKKFKELEQKDKYNTYQEDLAFAKELNILRNDFYYKMHKNNNISLIDFFYKPLDVLSGDAYSARKINRNEAFYFIVDGMGKGLSASLSSMLITSYINHIIDKQESVFSLEDTVASSIEYIRPILLDEEALAVDFILINHMTSTMQYAKFGMPPYLLQTHENKIIKTKSNNPPLSKYTKKFDISSIDVSNIFKFLFYSDGVIENYTIYNKLYAEYIEKDFLDSFTKDEFREKLLWKTQDQEDDMSFIFINQLDLNKDARTSYKRSFSSTLENIENANEWYGNILSQITTDYKLIYNAELFMNAYEHGNLAITSSQKHKLIQEDIYFTTLEELQKECQKMIHVDIAAIQYHESTYILTIIKDEGLGFDTHMLSKIFRNRKNFNGRGVYISRQSSLGLYYSDDGTTVLYLHRIDE